jgi:hypothetical protein
MDSRFNQELTLDKFKHQLSQVLNADGATKYRGTRCSKSVLNTICQSHERLITAMTEDSPLSLLLLVMEQVKEGEIVP